MSAQKELVTSFFGLIIEGRIDEAYEQYVDASFIHHNQYFSGERHSLLEGMKQAHTDAPNRSFTIHRMIEEGDLVMIHSHVQKEFMDIVVMHLCRCSPEGKIVEMWDVWQVIDPESPNKNGVF